MHGRVSAALALPVCSWTTACGWAGVSVCRPRSQQSLSACAAMCGSSSENQVPVSPCWRKANFEAVRVPPPGPGLPPFCWSCGLYSKVSICDIAPCMNRKMIRFAFGLKCGGFGARGCAGARAGGSRGGLPEHAGKRQVAEARAGGLENLASREQASRSDRQRTWHSPWKEMRSRASRRRHLT